tara:strand:+ start:296 stop:739 length:444 start_codon:yes stop_codon:yes gene_type:complete
VERLFVITGLEHPNVGVQAIDIEKVEGGSFRLLPNVSNPSDNALGIVNQPGPLEFNDIESHVDWRQDEEELTPWPEHTVFASRNRAVKSALSAIEAKLSALNHFAEFYYVIGPRINCDDEIFEREVDAYRISLQQSRCQLEIQLLAA